MHHLAPPNAMKNMMGCFIYYGKWSFVIKSITSLASQVAIMLTKGNLKQTQNFHNKLSDTEKI